MYSSMCYTNMTELCKIFPLAKSQKECLIHNRKENVLNWLYQSLSEPVCPFYYWSLYTRQDTGNECFVNMSQYVLMARLLSSEKVLSQPMMYSLHTIKIHILLVVFHILVELLPMYICITKQAFIIYHYYRSSESFVNPYCIFTISFYI